MKLRIDKSFDKDIDKIRDKKLLRKVSTFILGLEKAETIHEIPQVKKIEGYDSFYRIKIGDYRLGIELAAGNEIILLRFLNRKDIYRYFPKRR